MGLDQYAYRVKMPAGGPALADTDFGDIVGVEPESIAYFRKHHDLQGWMERLYRAKGGDKPDFNCTPVRLTGNDLQMLKRDVEADALPETSGFFFGSGNTAHYKAETLKFIGDAMAAIDDGYEVFYDSWW